MSLRPAHRHSGFTLIELLTVMSVFSVLLVISAQWLHQTVQFAATIRNRQRHHQNLQRLASELRDDIRQCRTLAVDGENQLTLRGGQTQTTTYTIDGTTIQVEKRQEDQIIYRDNFNLDRHAEAYWDHSELPDWVSLVVRRRPPNFKGLPDGKVHPVSSPGATLERSSSSPLDRPPPIELQLRAGPNPWN